MIAAASALLVIIACLAIPGLLYSILALLLPGAVIVLLTHSVQRLIGGTTVDAFKVVLGALSVGAILYWVLQGSLSTRLDVRMSAQTYEVGSKDKRQVITSFRIGNIGNNNVSVESAKLTIVPKNNGLVYGQPVTLNTADLNLVAGGNKDSVAVKMGVDRNKYFITWGTEETRQLSQVLAAADYYELFLELEVAQTFPRSVSTWRVSTVVPTGKERGRSPAVEEPEKNKSKEDGLLEGLLKKLKGE